ncbi:RNA polymerase sigma factor [Cellulomonas shaoxiangyii]|uniref:Sigma-70 family RNA polymerase sigma factor n=1 Tax=Cellulomonas shaoxiangyii TaxID=2566013 RepID=A0A4P7SN13_9CELL|nr:sigma-70 family RNA polymerase sigma factor [Cellulomonas shaoxiangyii]QCB94646.1 sigma-70 family RNA polymerase sigma factor [Cellulomonas shaoxiangyii]TGY76483.1 sigma-70 family RNA polymerase sigma factor [Cellulomonas shaoxiangyii]
MPTHPPHADVVPGGPAPAADRDRGAPGGTLPDAPPAPLAGAGPAGASPPAHDGAWFDSLVRAHATAVHRYVARRAGRSDAEDLTADVLTVAWRRRDDVPDGAELPWLYRTAGFVVANHRRKGRPVPVAEVPDVPDGDDPALRTVRDDTVRTVLAGLSARDREVLLLHAWEGLTGDALAAVLGTGRGGADAALSRARSRLRAAFAAVDA